MNHNNRIGPAFVLGLFLCAGLIGLGYWVTSGFMQVKALERSVTVKGLAEREVAADIAIWPIRFNDTEISVSVPATVDRQAQAYANAADIKFRYAATSTITVYSTKVDQVRNAMTQLVELGKQGLAIAGADYEARTQFLFTRLNDIKPDMIEAATRNAREVATRFAQDSDSQLGKIRRASQGQFSIEDRDSNTPHIKKVRVVSTVEYYLSD